MPLHLEGPQVVGAQALQAEGAEVCRVEDAAVAVVGVVVPTPRR